MAASITHEFAEFIKGAEFLLHGRSFHGEQLDGIGSGEPLEVQVRRCGAEGGTRLARNLASQKQGVSHA
jgi:hypothetical protein